MCFLPFLFANDDDCSSSPNIFVCFFHLKEGAEWLVDSFVHAK